MNLHHSVKGMGRVGQGERLTQVAREKGCQQSREGLGVGLRILYSLLWEEGARSGFKGRTDSSNLYFQKMTPWL